MIRLPHRPATRALIVAVCAWLGLAGRAGAQGTWTSHLNTKNLQSIVLDGEGVLAVGNGGARRFPRGATGTVTGVNRTENGLVSDHLTAVEVTPDGDVWFGTDQGISRWDRARSTWETIDAAFGLPSNLVTRLTRQGSLVWAGTQGGFAVLSGDTVILSCSSLQDSCLPDLRVNDILVGRANGGIGPYYFATQGGVAAFDGVNWLQLTRGLPSKSNVIAVGQLGDSLLAAVGSSLYAYRANGWQRVATSSDAILSLLSGDSRMLVGRTRGVSAWNGSALTPVQNPNGDEEGAPARQMVSSGDTVWVATQFGLRRFDGTFWSDLYNTFHVDEPASNSFYDIAHEACGRDRLWTAVVPGDLVQVYDPAQPTGSRWSFFTSPTLDPGFSFNVLVDRDCFKWIGHCCSDVLGVGGVDVIDDRSGPALARRYLNPPRNGLSSAEGPDGKKYFGSGGSGTEDGLYIFNPSDSSSSDPTRAWRLLQSGSGSGLPFTRQSAFAFRGSDVWIGGLGSTNPLAIWHTALGDGAGAWTRFQFGSSGPQHVPGQQVLALAFSGDSLWAGTEAGLSLIDARTETSIEDFFASAEEAGSNGVLPADKIQALAVGPNGDLWIGTPSGLALLRNGNFTIYNSRNSGLVSDDVSSLAVDASKNPYQLWIGTSFGLSQLVVGGDVTCTTCPPTTTSTTLRFYPHPFRPGRNQTLHLAGVFSGTAAIKIYDARGRVVREFSGVAPGQSFWDGLDSQGQPVGSGVYRARVEADGAVHRFVLAVIR